MKIITLKAIHLLATSEIQQKKSFVSKSQQLRKELNFNRNWVNKYVDELKSGYYLNLLKCNRFVKSH